MSKDSRPASESIPDVLLKDLVDLDLAVKAQIADDQSFHVANAKFIPPNDTTKLLLAACEKLLVVKDTLARETYEDHTAELPYLCGAYGTSLDRGLPDVERPAAASGPGRPDRGHSLRSLVACFQRPFPPSRGWWQDVSQRVQPVLQVLRGGSWGAVWPHAVLVGDVVCLAAGQRCPADLRVLVFLPGTAVDVSDLRQEAEDVRMCTAMPTSRAVLESQNMVLRGSVVVVGALIGVAVRGPTEALAPMIAAEPEEAKFLFDMSPPAGMTAAQCKGLFQQLCVRSRLACRSFKIMAKLAQSDILIVVLTQELLESGAPAALAASMRSLGRGLVFVSTACARTPLGTLAQDLQFEVVDVGRPAALTAGAAKVSAEACEAMYTTMPSEGGTVSTSPSPTSTFAGSRSLTSHDDHVTGMSLASDLVAKKRAGVILHGKVEAATLALCINAADRGARVTYAMGEFQLPDCFRKMVMATRTSRRNSAGLQAGWPSVSSSVESSTGKGLLPSGVAVPTPQGDLSTESPGPPAVSRMASGVSQTSGMKQQYSTFTNTDPASKLQYLKGSTSQCLSTVVSLNAIGAVSEYADAVLLADSLANLGQALELVTKIVPIERGPNIAGSA